MGRWVGFSLLCFLPSLLLFFLWKHNLHAVKSPLLVCGSIRFDKGTQLCGPSHNQDREHLHHPKMFLALCPFVINKLTPLNPNMWQPLSSFHPSIVLPCPGCHEWNHAEWSPLGLASFSSQNVFEMYSCCRIQQRLVPLILFIGHVYHRSCDCSSAPLLKEIWVVSSTKL